MININNLSCFYKDNGKHITALKDIDLEIKKGEIFGIIGPSGAGKSTLLRTINLLEKPDRGELIVDGLSLQKLPKKELIEIRQNIGMIFQNFNLFASRTVYSNVSFPLKITGTKKEWRDEKVRNLLELVGLNDKVNRYPAQLSGGEKQRVGIARALANEPDLLLSDEATSSLDPETTDSILELLLEIRDEMDLTIVLVTHEMDVVRKVCDRMAVIRDGMIVKSGQTERFFPKEKKVLGTNRSEWGERVWS